MSSTTLPEYPTFVMHLECAYTGEQFEPDQIHGLSPAEKPLSVMYDLDGIAAAVTKGDLDQRQSGMWRYREFLPVRRTEDVVSLGETETPLVSLPRLSEEPGTTEILVKDEGRLPTGSFKARGLAMAVSMAKALGLTKLAMPTNGNAGTAPAAYATRAEIETYIFCPDDTSEVNVREIAPQGANVWRVNGLINDCGKIVGAGKEPMGRFDVSTLKEPYRIEGEKTMGLELADQMGWKLPDIVFYPTGGGTGLIVMWKAFQELTAIGWLTGNLPRMVAVQSTGCAPIVKAFDEGAEHAPLWEDAFTIASGIRVPIAVGDFMILRAVRESNGFALAVTDGEIAAAHERVPMTDGMLICPEGAATFAAYVKALEEGLVSPDEQAVLFNCGSGLKYPMPPRRGSHRPHTADRLGCAGRAMTTRDIVTTEFTNEDAAASLAENSDDVYNSTLVSDRARGLVTTVSAHDPLPSVDDAAWEGFESLPLDDSLTQSNPLSSHVPLTDETRHLIGDHNVSMLQASSIRVNTARGGIVDEGALVGALRSGHLSSTPLNVSSGDSTTEAANSRYRGTPNTIATPHIAGISAVSGVRVGETTADGVRPVLGGATPS